MSDDFVLGAGEKFDGRDDDGESYKKGPVLHSYFSKEMGDQFARIMAHWKTMNGYKTCVVINPDHMNLTPTTLNQQIRQGKKWLLNYLSDGDLRRKEAVAIKVSQLKGGAIRLDYLGTDMIKDKVEDAMQFGEQRIDIGQQAMNWMRDDPAHGEEWPEEEVILSETDMAFFKELKRTLHSVSPIRFFVTLVGHSVKIMSNKITNKPSSYEQ